MVVPAEHFGVVLSTTHSAAIMLAAAIRTLVLKHTVGLRLGLILLGDADMGKEKKENRKNIRKNRKNIKRILHPFNHIRSE